ncbi:MAG: acetylglutamate kinase [Myxococcota bacterium]
MTRETIVVKLGGNAITGPERTRLCDDLTTLRQDHDLVVVHGGGPQTTALQETLGQTPKKVGGRRVTDPATLDVIKMVVGGKLNIDLCAALLRAGAQPIGLHGASACVVESRRRPPQTVVGGPPEPVDLGLVGDVVGLNIGLLRHLLGGGFLPVLACIGASPEGEVFNINADVVANRVAVELEAAALVLVSDIVGVLRDRDDPTTRIPSIRRGEQQSLIATGILRDGMVPKVVEAFRAVDQGVRRVHIVGRLGPGDLVAEMATPGSVGTVLRR